MSTPPPPTPQASLPQQPVEPGLSEPARIIDTFVAPSKTFIDIRRNASWWVPWLLLSIVGVSFIFVLDKKIGFDNVARTMMSSNAQFQNQPPERQEATLRLVAGSIKIFGYLSPIASLIYGLVIAAVLMGTFNFVMAAEVRFGQAMAITFYSWLVSIIGSLIAFLTMVLGNPEGFNLQNPVGTNIAYYLDPATTPKFLYSFLTSIDLLNFWLIGLIGLGFALNAKKKLSTGTAITVVAVWYFVAKLVAAGFAALRG